MNINAQFTSAITRDLAGALATNVVPSYDEANNIIRKDAYMLVANKALNLTRKEIALSSDISEKAILSAFKELLEKDGRKICKKPVMVSNYGGSAGGRIEILWDYLRSTDIERKFINKKNASTFAKIVGESIFGVLNGGKAFEHYIQDMNNIIAKINGVVTWNTLDGFYVVHTKKKELRSKQVKCLLPGSRRPTYIYKKTFSDKANAQKMKSAISPNYVHSLDAELLRRVALRMKSLLIESDYIHDSFGCHPNYAETLLFFCKDEFRKLVKLNPLKRLNEELREQMRDNKKALKKMDKIIVPDFKGFGWDLKDLINSDWFFS